MGAFSYVVPSDPDDKCIIIFIDLVFPMGSTDLPKIFCDFSETSTDIENTLVDTELSVPAYGAIVKIPSTRLGLLHTCKSLKHIYCYIDDVISKV